MNCFVTEGGGGWGRVNHVLACQLDPVLPILTKIGMDFDPKNKPAE